MASPAAVRLITSGAVKIIRPPEACDRILSRLKQYEGLMPAEIEYA